MYIGRKIFIVIMLNVCLNAVNEVEKSSLVSEMSCSDRTNFPSNLIKGLFWVYTGASEGHGGGNHFSEIQF